MRLRVKRFGSKGCGAHKEERASTIQEPPELMRSSQKHRAHYYCKCYC